MQQFWNERYTQHSNIYGSTPNYYFKKELDKLIQKGKLLLAGEGEGRNAIYATQQGWEVSAFDSSEIAIEHALLNAKNVGVSFDYTLASASEYTAEENSFDVIGLVFFHLMPEERIAFHHKVIKWLKPGGTLIIEGFNPKQLGNPSGGPKELEMLYSMDMMYEDFGECASIELHTDTVVLNEGPFHQGEAELIHVVVKK